ncbi:DUF3987 domain-containing protein [Thiomonas sp.]|uniref:YfjI family protein n=1 Tax=Thiomonas sp. TaxID=2047785 RepID=UPI002587EDD3|nr:DUF3987 domain-containing protein [Thiomonas sp.]
MHQDDEGRFVMGEAQFAPGAKPLYMVHDLAQHPDAVAIVTEGEKAADALAKIGMQSTTSGAADSCEGADWQPLAGRTVLIWPDNDEPGAKYGQAVADKLRALGCNVSTIDVQALGLPPKGDAVEWLEERPDATADDVLALPVVQAEEPADAWPQPQPLPEGLPPVDPFDAALLPDAIRAWVIDIATRVSCPPDYVAVPAMLALSCALGRKVAVRPQRKADWTVIANLWGLVIGRPGMMKSPAMSQATAPLKRLAARAQDEHAAALADWKQADKLRELQAEAGEKNARTALAKNPHAEVSHLIDGGAGEPEPALRRYTTANATPEALGELLRQNPQGLMLERDEIMGLLRDLDREDKADHRAFLLEAWDGNGSFTFDRIGRGFNLHIPAMCLSIVGTTQPSRMLDYMGDALHGGAGDDGLVQRFSMMIWPDATGTWRDVDRWPDGGAKKAAWDVFDRLDTLKASDVLAEQDNDLNGNPEGAAPYLRLDDNALALFLEWRTTLEARLRSGDLHPAVESHLAKYRKLVPALALICHLADHGTGPVTEAAMLRALGWAVYLESHAMRVYGGAVSPELEVARAVLRRIKRGDLPRDGFSSRDVWRPGWAGLADRDLVGLALAYLVEMDWLKAEAVKTDGRPATVYTVNPRGRL